MIGGSSIINPDGHVIAGALTKEDELIIAPIDLAEWRHEVEKR